MEIRSWSELRVVSMDCDVTLSGAISGELIVLLGLNVSPLVFLPDPNLNSI